MQPDLTHLSGEEPKIMKIIHPYQCFDMLSISKGIQLYNIESPLFKNRGIANTSISSEKLALPNDFFSARSDSSIINKFKLSLRVAPPIATFSLLIGMLKSLFIVIKNVIK